MSNVMCGKCGKVYLGHDNRLGKMCRCGSFIPPKRELPIVEDNRRKMDALKVKLFEQIQKKHGDVNAYFKQQRPTEH